MQGHVRDPRYAERAWLFRMDKEVGAKPWTWDDMSHRSVIYLHTTMSTKKVFFDSGEILPLSRQQLQRSFATFSAYKLDMT